MQHARLPGFTAELSLDAGTRPYRAHTEQRLPNTGRVSAQAIIGSVCNASSGRRICFGMGRYHPGLIYQFDCGPCGLGPGFGGPTSFM